MTYRLHLEHGLIAVRATLRGPSGRLEVVLGLDTGSVYTVIAPAALGRVGYEGSAQIGSVAIVTFSGQEMSPRFEWSSLDALGRTRSSFPVLSHTLPLSNVHGLLGLDFLKGHDLRSTFPAGTIDLA